MMALCLAIASLAAILTLAHYVRRRNPILLCLAIGLAVTTIRIWSVSLNPTLAWNLGAIGCDLAVIGALSIASLQAYRLLCQTSPSGSRPTEKKKNAEDPHALAQQIEEQSVQLEQISHDLKQSRRHANDFITKLSHEIRQPLTSILGFAEMLRELPNTRESKEVAATIQRNSTELLELMSDVLDLANLESGKLRVERVACGPKQVVEEVVELIRGQAEAKGLQLAIEYDGKLPGVIRTDVNRLRQALVNLLANAVRFTENGSITITPSLLEPDSAQAQLEISITDTGIGIPEQQQGQLFHAFARGRGTAEPYAGSGLGLAISRHLIELLDGTIEVSSRLHWGSTFTIRIPLGKLDQSRLIDPTQQQPPARAKRHRGSQLNAKILLVEDCRDNQRLISFVLKRAGALVELADEGAQGVSAVRQAEAEGDPFDLILMDMQMPVLNGFEATVQLRGSGFANPIVALTALALDGDRERCLEAGCDDYITKPINRESLLQVVSDYANRTRELPAPAETAKVKL